ncbi:helix-turn-helix domain-containing protein [Streptantibioticus parmotrematis]|uniref:telomere-protecting terminal protein Tpg n=1 Tax=Streptantibioticus parmotrematis TaxID=2873249 RepID=UPI0034037328
MDDTTPPSARRSGMIRAALARAEQAVFTRPAPKSAKAQMKFLHTRAKGSTRALAERLGVSRSTVHRYLTGTSTKPHRRLQETLTQETEDQWQSQVRAQGRQRAATSGGLVITCRATFGFTANGTSDDARVRDIITAVSPSHAARILDAKERGATDAELRPLLAEAISESYFREGGTARAGLRADFRDVEHLQIDF